MEIRVGEIRQIVKEEIERQDRVQEAVPFGGVAGIQRGRGRRPSRTRRRRRPEPPRPGQYDPHEDMVVPGDVQLEPAAMDDVRRALDHALRAMSNFNPRWHRWVCRTPQAQEMSDIVIELERGLKNLARELRSVSEAIVLDADGVRQLVEAEIGRTDEASFLGMFKLPSGRGRRPRQARDKRQTSWEKVPAKDVRTVSPTITKVRTLISDMITLYDTFGSKLRRRKCLGKPGEELIQRLQTLDDMLERL